MNFNDYQTKALRTAVYPDSNFAIGVSYTCLGLTNEAGEVAGTVKKFFRDSPDYCLPTEHEWRTFQEKMKAELGDTLWYIAAVAKELDLSLDEIAVENIEKLTSRASRGTIKGSGDDR